MNIKLDTSRCLGIVPNEDDWNQIFMEVSQNSRFLSTGEEEIGYPNSEAMNSMHLDYFNSEALNLWRLSK